MQQSNVLEKVLCSINYDPIGPDARLAVVGGYVVLFGVADDVVYIERIVYGSRDLPPLFEQR